MSADSQTPSVVDAQSVLDEIDQTRELINGFIEEANDLSTRAVLNVSDEMQSVVSEANEYITELKARMSSLTDSHEGSLTNVVRDQLDVVHAYLDRVQTTVDEQHKIAQQAVEQSRGIYKAGSLIGQMTQAVKILALNAQIEASRLGVDNQALGVISQEMLRLSKTVDSTNRAVRSLTQGLADTLPTLAEQAETMAVETRHFSQELTVHSARVEKSNADVMELVMTSLKDGDDRIATILEHSYTVLSELQFQDPMIQTIQRVDIELQRMTQRLIPESEDQIKDTNYIVTIGEQYADIEVDDDDIEELDFGEILLF